MGDQNLGTLFSELRNEELNLNNISSIPKSHIQIVESCAKEYWKGVMPLITFLEKYRYAPYEYEHMNWDKKEEFKSDTLPGQYIMPEAMYYKNVPKKMIVHIK